MENLTPDVQSAGEAEKPSWAIPPKTERDLLIAALRVVNETSGTLNDLSAELFKVTGDEADDPKYERLHELLRRRFDVNSGVHLFQAAHNLKIDLPDDLKGESESDIEDDGEPPDTDEAVWHVAEGGMVRLELREAYYAASDRVFNVLLLTGDTDVHLSTVEGWSLDQRKAAAEWALSLYTAASDNDDVIVPPRPDFIPRRSADGRNPVTGEPLPAPARSAEDPIGSGFQLIESERDDDGEPAADPCEHRWSISPDHTQRLCLRCGDIETVGT